MNPIAHPARKLAVASSCILLGMGPVGLTSCEQRATAQHNAATEGTTTRNTNADEPDPPHNSRISLDQANADLAAQLEDLARMVTEQDEQAAHRWIDTTLSLDIEYLRTHMLSPTMPEEVIEALGARLAEPLAQRAELVERQVERFLGRRPRREPDSTPDECRAIDLLQPGWEEHMPGKIRSLIPDYLRGDLMLGTLRFGGVREWFFHDGTQWMGVILPPPGLHTPRRDEPLNPERNLLLETRRSLLRLVDLGQEYRDLRTPTGALSITALEDFADQQAQSVEFVDAWGHPIVTHYDQSEDTDWYGSPGPDGQMGTDDDLWMDEWLLELRPSPPTPESEAEPLPGPEWGVATSNTIRQLGLVHAVAARGYGITGYPPPLQTLRQNLEKHELPPDLLQDGWGAQLVVRTLHRGRYLEVASLGADGLLGTSDDLAVISLQERPAQPLNPGDEGWPSDREVMRDALETYRLASMLQVWFSTRRLMDDSAYDLSDFEEARANNQLLAAMDFSLEDAWGSRFTVEVQADNQVSVVSSGPDGIAGNADDMRAP